MLLFNREKSFFHIEGVNNLLNHKMLNCLPIKNFTSLNRHIPGICPKFIYKLFEMYTAKAKKMLTAKPVDPHFDF